MQKEAMNFLFLGNSASGLGVRLIVIFARPLIWACLNDDNEEMERFKQ